MYEFLFCQNTQLKFWQLTEGHRCLLLSFLRFLSAHFSSLTRSLWMVTEPRVFQPLLPVSYQLQTCVGCTGSYRLLVNMLTHCWQQCETLRSSNVLPPAGPFGINHNLPDFLMSLTTHLTVPLTNPHLISLSVSRENVKSPPIIEKNILCPTLTHQASYRRLSGSQSLISWLQINASYSQPPYCL